MVDIEPFVPIMQGAVDNNPALKELYERNYRFNELSEHFEGSVSSLLRKGGEVVATGAKVFEAVSGTALAVPTLGAIVPVIETVNTAAFFGFAIFDFVAHHEAFENAKLPIKLQDWVMAGLKTLNPIGVIPRWGQNLALRVVAGSTDNRFIEFVQAGTEGALVSPVDQALTRIGEEVKRPAHEITAQYLEYYSPDFKKLSPRGQRVAVEKIRRRAGEILKKSQGHR